MTQANDGFLKAADGAGTNIATHLVGTKEYQVVIPSAASGHILGTEPAYFYNIATSVHVAAASTLWWDMFNADATAIVRVLHIEPIVNLETAVTGVGFEWQLLRTTAVGTGWHRADGLARGHDRRGAVGEHHLPSEGDGRRDRRHLAEVVLHQLRGDPWRGTS
jgi:hypothetical protein